MFHISFVNLILICSINRIFCLNQRNQFNNIYNQQQSIANQKWYYSSNQPQRPTGYSWYWPNYYDNSFQFYQNDQSLSLACGKSPIENRFSRIMGGQDAQPHSYPWMVSLGKRSINDLHLCGGALITKQHILTAAHCLEDFKGLSDMSIFVGIHYLSERKNPLIPLSVDIHPEYDSSTFANDVAIITLTAPVPDNDPRIGTICLPSDDRIDKLYSSSKSYGVAIGWGSTSFGGRPTTSLKQAALPILETSKWPCNIYVTFAQGQMCAGELSGGVDTCQADSGGPLMVENSYNRWEIVGITSFGKSCGKPNTPGIYTRVGAYNNFIRSRISLSRNNQYYYYYSSSAVRIYFFDINLIILCYIFISW